MKKKKLLMLITLFCLIFTWTVFTLPLTSTHAASLPRVLNLATHALGSKYNALGSGIGSILSAHMTTEIKVMPTGGPTVWMPMIRSEEVDLGIANNWDSMNGWLATGPYNKILKGQQTPIRLLTNGTPNINGVTVIAGGDIKTGKDLKGKRYVGKFAGSAAATSQAEGALANFGLTLKDVKLVVVPGVAQGVKALIEGRADATGSSVIGMGVIAELDAAKGARFLSFDPSPEAARKYAQFFPAVPYKVEPGPKKIGVRGPIYMMKYDSYLIGRKTLSEETAYQIVKTLWEFNKELWPIHGALRSWTTDIFVTTLATVPYHPGAIKYYKEKGVWTSEMEQVQKRLLSKEK